jgi:cytochrome b
MTNRILVWDIPTRIFHWSLALSFATAYITAESERWRDVHVISGYLLLGLIAFRLVWGLVGSRHARFADFVRGPAAVMRYLRSLLSGRPEHHVGHNPAGAVVIVLLLALGLASGASGWATYNEIGGDLLEELHEALAGAMLALVGIHLAGVAVASFLHRENLVKAMVTGYKKQAPE